MAFRVAHFSWRLLIASALVGVGIVPSAARQNSILASAPPPASLPSPQPTAQPTPQLSLARGHSVLDLTQLSFATDGQTLITSHNAVVRSWDLASGIPQRKWGEAWQEGYIRRTFLAPDGRTLLVFHDNGHVVFWDRLTGERERTLHTDSLSAPDKRDANPPDYRYTQPPTPALSSDGRTLFTYNGDNYDAWDLKTGVGRKVVSHETLISALAAQLSSVVPVKEQGTSALSTKAYSLQRWNVQAGTFALSPDNQTLATACFVSREDWRDKTASSPADHVAIFSNVIGLWDVATGRLKSVLSQGEWGSNELAFSPDGKRLACRVQRLFPTREGNQGIEYAIRVWDIPVSTLRYTLLGASGCNGSNDSLGALAFSPDSQFLASSDTDTDVVVWNASTGQVAYRWQEAGGRTPGTYRKTVALAFAPDGGTLASASQVGTITVRRFPTGEITRTIRPDAPPEGVIGFSSDGRFLVARHGRLQVAVWDVPNATLLRVLPIFLGYSQPFALSPDGQTLATTVYHRETAALVTASTASPDKALPPLPVTKPYTEVKLWDTLTGQQKEQLIRVDGNSVELVFSPDSTKLALSSTDLTLFGFGRQAPIYSSSIRVWDAIKGTLLWADEEHDAMHSRPSFSPDGELLASVRYVLTPLQLNLAGRSRGGPNPRRPYSQGEVRLWNTQTGHVERSFASQDNAIFVTFLTQSQAAAFRDPYVLTCVTAQKGIWLFWDAATGALISTLKTKTTRPPAFLHSTFPYYYKDDDLFLSPDGSRLLTTTAQQYPRLRGPLDGISGFESIGIEQVFTQPDRSRSDFLTLPDSWGGVFSPDGTILATNSVDGIALWDWRNGRRLLTFDTLDNTTDPLPTATNPPSPPLLPPWAAFTPQGDYKGSPGIEAFLQQRWGDVSLPAGTFAHHNPEQVKLTTPPRY